MTDDLALVINGRFLSQQMTGVQRMAREFVWALDRMMVAGHYPRLSVRLIAQHDAYLGGNELRAIELERIAGGRGHHWEQFTLPQHLGNAALLCLGNTAPVSALLRRFPVAVVLHDLAYRLYPADYSLRYRIIHRAIDHVTLRRARPLVTVSEAERRVIAAFDPAAAERILVAPNGAFSKDEPSAVRWAPLGGGEAYGLYVGSLSHRKNVSGVLAVAIELARSARFHFKFVGPAGAASSAAARSIPADVRPLITFRGYVEDDELADLYAGASLLLYPSFYEASGLPPVEAMGVGCPVIVSDIAVMHERCVDAALYCDPHDHGSMLRAARSLIGQPPLAHDLSRRGPAQSARYTWSAQVARVIDAIAAEMKREADPAGG